MNPISQNLHSLSQDAIEQSDRAQTEHIHNEANAGHQAVLFRGRTTFAYARSAQAQLLGNMRLANKLRDRLAQARRRKTMKFARFALPRKTVVCSLRQPTPHNSTWRGGLSRYSGSRVMRRGGDGDQRGGGGGGGGGGQQSPQQDGKKQHQGGHQDRHKQKSDKRFSTDGVSTVAPPRDDTVLPDWLTIALSLEAGDAREQAVANACCDQLLALRDEIVASPQRRCDARIYRIAREVAMARAWLGTSSATGFGPVRARLVERALLHASASGLQEKNQQPLVSRAGTRPGNFNLLLGLQLFNIERNVINSRLGRATCALASLESGASDEGDNAPEEHNKGIPMTSEVRR